MGKDCSRQSFYISTIPGGHAGGTSPRTGEGRTMQEPLSRAMYGRLHGCKR